MATARHRMNVLFNVMRGGVFDEGYTVQRDAVRAFVPRHNAPVAEAHADWFDALPETLTVEALRAAAEDAGPQLQRLAGQYLPLHFSRRHGDPSRPWNHFSIEVRDDDGGFLHSWEGNWRDIFQNWEALGRSFPNYLEGMVAVFVSASTADGYNPYRITDRGIDWETVEPDDPWSYIGYWGDHQIIYLLRLLAQLQAHDPDRLAALLDERRFSYANVPYRIAPYAAILRDPHDTVAYDEEEEERIAERIAAVGADGKLLWDGAGDVLLVTLGEKLLVPLLAKLTNFVPGGGIWMNTQRPEWNDANNALVGYGVSVVTLFAVRRYLAFLRDLLTRRRDGVRRSGRADGGRRRCVRGAPRAGRPVPLRRRAPDGRGRARRGGQRHRSGSTRRADRRDAGGLGRRARRALGPRPRRRRPDPAREPARRRARPQLQPAGGRRRHVGVWPLYPMLEGQVAALDAGVLSAAESLRVVRALAPARSTGPTSTATGSTRTATCRASSTRTSCRRTRPSARRCSPACSTPATRASSAATCAVGSTFTAPFATPTTSPPRSTRWRRPDARCPMTTASGCSPCSRTCSTTAPTPAAPARSSATRGWAASTGTWSPSWRSPLRRPSSAPTPTAPTPQRWPRSPTPTTTSAPGWAGARRPPSSAPSRPTPTRTRRATRAPSSPA